MRGYTPASFLTSDRRGGTNVKGLAGLLGRLRLDVRLHERSHHVRSRRADQENIARGHSAYYLKWTNEALADSGTAFSQKGPTTVGQLSAAVQKLRKSGISSMDTARQRFAAFDFIGAAFAAQKAWRAAAFLRDDALGLAPGRPRSRKAQSRRAHRVARSATC